MLVPDHLCAYQAKKLLAEQGLRHVKVGDFSMLLQTLSELWLVPMPKDDWDDQFQQSALSLSNCFWSASCKVDQQSTLLAVKKSLLFALDALSLRETQLSLNMVNNNANNARTPRYLNDLSNLFNVMKGQRPQQQALAQAWLLAVQQGRQPLEELTLIGFGAWGDYALWQREILTEIDLSTSGLLLENDAFLQVTRVLETQLPVMIPQQNDSSKKLVQHQPTHLLGLVCRDKIELCHTTASMVQQAIEKGATPENMAIVYPHNSDYASTLMPFLTKAGIAVSNANPQTTWVDWQSHLIRDLILYQTQHHPALALQAIVTNALMPWSWQKGFDYAHQIAQGRSDFTKKSDHEKEVDTSNPDTIDTDHEQPYQQRVASLLALFAPNAITTLTASNLIDWVKSVIALVNQHIIFSPLTKARMQERLAMMESLFHDDDPIEKQLSLFLNQWHCDDLHISQGEGRYKQSAVWLVSDQEELPFTVDHLWVVGLQEGHFDPQRPNTGAIALTEWAEVRLGTHLFAKLHTYFTDQQHQSAHLHSMLTKVTGRCFLLRAKQDLDGQPLREGRLVHQLQETFGATFVPVMLAEDVYLIREQNDCQPLTDAQAPLTLHFNTNLQTALTQFNAGKARPESPSSLEKLMVSPLAWLLNRMHLESRLWAEQSLDIMLQGTIAHKVFECYGKNNQSSFNDLFTSALAELAPFLLQNQWRMERAHLAQEIHAAFDVFTAWVQQEGWTIIKVEELLTGQLWNTAMTGFADAILKKGNDFFILDYKKSKSKDRVTRLKAGYDLQTYIYRKLYCQQNQTVVEGNIITGYYNLQDKVLLVDQAIASSAQPVLSIQTPAIAVNNQSLNAVTLIDQRMQEIQKGEIVMNQAQDKAVWDKRGIKMYALELSMINRFLLP